MGILPLFSQVPAAANLSTDQIKALDKHTQDAGTEVVNAKGGKGSATLSMAFAGAKFANAMLTGLAGQDTDECAYVMRDAGDAAPYLASKVTFGANGVKRVHPVGNMNDYERTRMQEALGLLKDEIEAGLSYAKTTELTR